VRRGENCKEKLTLARTRKEIEFGLSSKEPVRIKRQSFMKPSLVFGQVSPASEPLDGMLR
jgi:hypothetical protein